jgi:hypothetical protein
MEVKKNIENLLLLLKEQGIDRRQIEKDLDYRKYYIDQLLSKGGNRKFLNRLEKYNIAKRNDVDKKIPAITDINFIGGKTMSSLIEQIITLQASVNVLVPTVSNILELQKAKGFALIFGELNQAIEDEKKRLLRNI